MWPFCGYSHCQAGLLCSAPDEALRTPSRTKPIVINCTNWCGRSQGWGTTLLTSMLGKEHGCPTISAPRAQPCLGSLRHPGSGQTPAWEIFVRRKALEEALHHFRYLLLSWAGTGETVKAVLCAWYGSAAKALLTAELVASPELLWGLIPTAEMGRGFGLTSSVPGWPQGSPQSSDQCLIHLLSRRGLTAGTDWQRWWGVALVNAGMAGCVPYWGKGHSSFWDRNAGDLCCLGKM